VGDRLAREELLGTAHAPSLALPDNCGFLESPTRSSQARYVDWCNRFMIDRYTTRIGAEGEPHVFLSGDDPYALRCAFLHGGADDTSRQRARRALERFDLGVSPGANVVHRHQRNQRLQLQVGIFCEKIPSAIENWIRGVLQRDPDEQTRNAEPLTIHTGY
jgi:hypothetical protein